MNRIILIGNGFDIAHNLPTKYTQFIDDYWKKNLNNIKELPQDYDYENDQIIINKLPSSWKSNYNNKESDYNFLKKNLKRINSKIIFKNKIFERITDYTYIKNWVDIENEYYRFLKIGLKTDLSSYFHTLPHKIGSVEYLLDNILKFISTSNISYNTSENTISKIEKLNIEFNEIKNLLISYLTEVQNKGIGVIKNIEEQIYDLFNNNDFTEKYKSHLLSEKFNAIEFRLKNPEEAFINNIELENQNDYKLIKRLKNTDYKKELLKIIKSKESRNYFNLRPKDILFLNFNYTNTEEKYVNNNYGINSEAIHIHGSINQIDNNPIIFGYGDELDEDYKKIENLNENIYLENIKSIKYLETDNHKRLLEFIESDEYQVFIFGHSCGNSDRTLLNTLFEHENCVSIKPFYYIDENGKDNYSDIVRNISRCFNDKASMRDKVVNKKFCTTLV